MFSVTSSAIEGEAINTWNRWFESIGQVHYPIGPLAVPKAGLYGADEHENDETHVPVVDFLDRMQEKYGEQCVIYVRPSRIETSILLCLLTTCAYRFPLALGFGQ